ncbi:MAG: HEAT repeat domain-containing protein [Deltaproteobacteria bacterium]|nr:HEAT repeat domain-containing protein [Deltaproteobacteria bacterium]
MRVWGKIFFVLIMGLESVASYGASSCRLFLPNDSEELQRIKSLYTQAVEHGEWQEAWESLTRPLTSNLVRSEDRRWVRLKKIDLLKDHDFLSKKAVLEYIHRDLWNVLLFLEDFHYWKKDEAKTLEELKERWKREGESEALAEKETRWRSRVDHFAKWYFDDLAIEQEPFFLLVGSPNELFEYYAALADVLYQRGFFELAISYWEKALTYHDRVPLEGMIGTILKDLKWTKDDMAEKMSQLSSQAPSQEFPLEFVLGAFCTPWSEGKTQCYFLPDQELPIAAPIGIGNRIFILSYRSSGDVRVSVFDQASGTLLIQRDLFTLEPWSGGRLIPEINFTNHAHKELVILSSEIEVRIDPLLCEVTSISHIKGGSFPSSSHPLWTLARLLNESHRPNALNMIKQKEFQISFNIMRKYDAFNYRWLIADVLANIVLPSRNISIEELTFIAQKGKNSDSRIAALLALNQVQALKSLAAIFSVLEDPNLEVKLMAIELLGRCRYRPAVEPLITMFPQEISKRVKLAIVNALGGIGDSIAFDLLISLLGESDLELQEAAIQSLGLIGSRDLRVYHPMMSLLKEPKLQDPKYKKIKGAVIMALGRIKDSRAVDPLLLIVQDIRESSEIIRVTVQSLGWLHDLRAIDAIIPLLQNKDPNVRNQARQALQTFSNQPDISSQLKERIESALNGCS